MTAAEILSRLKKNRQRREQNLSERDELILEAKAAGVPVTHIAAAIGLDRTQVHRIIRDSVEQEVPDFGRFDRESSTTSQISPFDIETHN